MLSIRFNSLSWASIIILLLLSSPMILSSCSEESETVPVTDDTYTRQILEQGELAVDADGVLTSLSLRPNEGPWNITVAGNDEEKDVSWCQTSTAELSDEWDVTIEVQPNKSMTMRHATLELTGGNRAYTIRVSQMPTRQMVAASAHIDVRGEGGDVYVRLKTNVEPKLEKDRLPAWLHFADTQSTTSRATDESPRELVFRFTADKNANLGRLGSVSFTAEGTEDFTVNIHQWSRKLQETEEIHVDQPGQLGILLGGNAEDWANIRTLKLSGTLNTTDMQALRALLRPAIGFQDTNATGNLTIAYSVPLNVRHLDMKHCTLAAGGENYQEYSIATSEDTYQSAWNTLSDKAFLITRMPLQSIVLPDNLETIGDRAFYMSRLSGRLDIPASVKHIDGYAFCNSVHLTQIVLPEDSKLETLGMYALDTGSMLEEITFPASLQIQENMGILGNLSCPKIHVRWTTPPVLKRFRVPSGATLYVPKGSGEAYRKADKWNNAKDIIEE